MENYGNELYKEWLGAFASIGIPAISRDTAARILAVTYVHGNNEALVFNNKYLEDVKHIQCMYNIDGAATPDSEIVELIDRYVKELEKYRDDHSNESKGEALFRNHAPGWAHELFKERYGIILIN